MANNQNLRPGEHKLSKEEASKGGKASAEARRKKRDLRLALEMLLEKEIKGANGEIGTGTDAITARLFREALSGNVRAFEVIRDTVGQKPVEKVAIAEVDPAIVADVERAVLGEKGTSD